VLEHIRGSSDWRFVAAIVPVMILLQVLGPEHFRYSRDWISSGEIWRIVTAHWVHVGWIHLLFNGLSLIVCVSLTSPGWSIGRWLIYTLSMAIGISLLITLFNPEVLDYAGHSGLLYGLFVLGALRLYRQDRLIAVLVISAIVIKVFMEQFEFFDFNTADLIGARVVVDAHLYGLLMAIAIALVIATYTMNQSPTRQSD
jgi:rhomboid family GlyGly-CTERM serine protease